MPFFAKILACLILLLTTNNAYASNSSIVAVVNGELISYLDLENRVKPLLNPGINKASEEAKNVYRSVLDEMIQEEILIQEARRSGYSPRPETIDAEIAHRITASNLTEAQFYANLQKEGMTKEAFRKQIEKSFLISQLVNANVLSKIVVTDNDIREYYKKYEKAFSGSEYHFALIVYPDQAEGEKYAQDIKSGKLKFKDIAQKVSVGPNAANGGDMGYMKDADVSNEILYYMQNLNKGESTSLISLGSSKAQVMLIDKRAASTDLVINDAVRNSIKEVIVAPMREERYNAYLTQLNKKALVDIRYE